MNRDAKQQCSATITATSYSNTCISVGGFIIDNTEIRGCRLLPARALQSGGATLDNGHGGSAL
jgi:hypothetical protein